MFETSKHRKGIKMNTVFYRYWHDRHVTAIVDAGDAETDYYLLNFAFCHTWLDEPKKETGRSMALGRMYSEENLVLPKELVTKYGSIYKALAVLTTEGNTYDEQFKMYSDSCRFPAWFIRNLRREGKKLLAA